MKKVWILLIVLAVLVPAAVSASPFGLSLGVTGLYSDTFGQISKAMEAGDYDGFSNIDNYRFGADLRIKLLLAEIDAVAMFGSEDGATNISMLTTAGLSFDLFGLLRIGAGVGPRFTVNIESDGSMWVKDSNGNQVDLENAGEAFLKSPLAYRLTADLKLGKILLGLNYTLDTNYTFEESGKSLRTSSTLHSTMGIWAFPSSSPSSNTVFASPCSGP